MVIILENIPFLQNGEVSSSCGNCLERSRHNNKTNHAHDFIIAVSDYLIHCHNYYNNYYMYPHNNNNVSRETTKILCGQLNARCTTCRRFTLLQLGIQLTIFRLT